MTFVEAVRSGFNNYAGFSGRASRSAYWYWALFEILVAIVDNVIASLLSALALLPLLVAFALLLPGLAVGVRRLHDIGKTGWNMLWAFVPLLGALYLIYLFVQPGESEANDYGPNPYSGAVTL